MINIISGAVSIAACFITLFTIDKIGRKPYLFLGSVGMAFTLSILVYTFAQAGIDDSGNLIIGDMGTTALGAANAYVFFFNLSWGPVMWVMLGEMFPNQIRGLGLAGPSTDPRVVAADSVAEVELTQNRTIVEETGSMIGGGESVIDIQFEDKAEPETEEGTGELDFEFTELEEAIASHDATNQIFSNNNIDKKYDGYGSRLGRICNRNQIRPIEIRSSPDPQPVYFVVSFCIFFFGL